MADVPINTPEAIDAHRRRTRLAREVLLKCDRLAKSMAPGVASNAAITTDDNDIEFTVNSIWSAYAGVVLTPQLERVLMRYCPRHRG